MKRINLLSLKPCLLFTTLAVLLCGCSKPANTYIIENETTLRVIVYGYAVRWSEEMHNPVLYSESIEIQPSSEYRIVRKTGENEEPQGIFEFVIGIDSVIISFNDEKFIRYTCNFFNDVRLCNDRRNILNYEKYYLEDCSGNDCSFTYSITEEDYQKAGL